MKTLIIVLLGLALLTGLGLSRPPGPSFEAFLAKRSSQENRGVLAALFKKGPDATSYDYKDWFLVAAEEKEGKIIYVGIFSQWFKISSADGA